MIELGWLNPLIESLLGKYGVLVQIFLWIGVLRAANKPLFAAARAVVAATPTSKDDEALTVVEQSKIYKGVCFVLDWIASIKLPGAK